MIPDNRVDKNRMDLVSIAPMEFINESTGFEKPQNKLGWTANRRVAVDTRVSARDALPTPSDSPTNGSANGSANGSKDISEPRKGSRQKYRHVHAIHSTSKPSCLSHDATEMPSFLGFRNLMVIVLGEQSSNLLSRIPSLTPIDSCCQPSSGHREHPEGIHHPLSLPCKTPADRPSTAS
jgi:hypothetical protein